MTPKVFIIDANVLIDYVKSDRTVLALAAQHIGGVSVLSTVLSEVAGLDAAECGRLGIQVFEPEVAELVEAGRLQGQGGLSFQDHLCLLVAKTKNLTCISNDGALRRACTSAGVHVMWGMEVMVLLVKAGQLPSTSALQIARAIHRSNPKFISEAVLNRFEQKLNEVEFVPPKSSAKTRKP